MTRLFSRLRVEPIGSVYPRFDKAVLFLLKVTYLIHRVLMRIIVGRQKREALFLSLDKRLHYSLILSGYFSPSFYIISRFYESDLVKKIDRKHPRLFKINVTKYNYRVYCAPVKNDFIGLTTREEDIIDRYFTPKEGDTVFDVGAHVGRYTLIASRRVGSTGSVIAIEPDPANIKMLNMNIGLNNLTNIQILSCAVCAEQKRIKLYLPGNDSKMSIYNTIMQDRAHSSERTIEVDGYTLDFIADKYLKYKFEDNKKENWIKIDVEGAEYEVLKGATNLLSRNQPTSILVEIHNLREGFNLYQPVIELLKEYNFSLEFEKVYGGGEKHIVLKKYLRDSIAMP
jgi:FkbM family methyltransferase